MSAQGQATKTAAKIVAAGTYLALCTDIALTKSSEKGTRQVEAIFKIQQPGSEFDGRQVGWRSFFSEKTAEKTFESLENMGLPSPAAVNLKLLPTLAQSDKAKLVSIVVDHEEGEKEGVKKMYARVRWVNGGGGAKIKSENKLDDAENDEFAREMAALYGGGAKSAAPDSKPAAAKAAPAKPAAKKAPAAPAPVEDEDIPF